MKNKENFSLRTYKEREKCWECGKAIGVDREKLRRRLLGRGPKRGKPTSICNDEEEQLASWVDNMVDSSWPVTREMITKTAKLLNPKLKCSNRWFSGFENVTPWLSVELRSWIEPELER
eukprot:Pompholyxophrys_sp_v1_NODE_98_length_2029_cov_1.880446.p2 type:complete len:119 gc:universal NODE_98_length_2029_cov_1.880446:1758-1402(-)